MTVSPATNTDYDCIVLGIGGVGSATLNALVDKGLKVLGIDQFPPGHDHGSSHGDTRIIRLAYFEHPDYVPLLRRAFEKWRELDATSDQPIFQQCGILQAGPPEGEVIPGLLKAADTHDLSMEQLNADDLQRRFPGFSANSEDTILFDPNGGILRVEEAIKLQILMAKSKGADTLIGESVTHWHSLGDSVQVETTSHRYQCKHLVITAGPWASTQLPALANQFTILRKSLFWFDNDDNRYRFDQGCPVFLFESGHHTFYGFPQLDGKGIKIADHAGGRIFERPEDIDEGIDTNELEAVSLFLRQHLPGVTHQLNHHIACRYTMSPDGHFLVGNYPGEPRVQIAAGLSGHGYKFATVIAEALADLVANQKTDLPIEFLSPERFF